MATQKINAELPKHEQEVLRKLKDLPERDKLYARVLALRDKGWPLRAIADAMEVSRMSIQIWETKSRKNEDTAAAAAKITTVPDLPLNARGSGFTVKKMQMDISPADRVRLTELVPQAKQVRGWTPKDAPERLAAQELDALLIKYVEHRKVPPMTVARRAGVTRRAVVARIERAHARTALKAIDAAKSSDKVGA